MRFDTDVPGRQVDARVFQWNNWWVKRAVLSGQNPMYTDMIYYPVGASLSSHNTNWIGSVITIPIDLLFGPVIAYNITFLMTFFLAAFSMYLMVKQLTQRRDAAFIAGLVFAFFPYHVSGNWDGQMNLANIQWLPLFMLFVLRLAAQKKVWDAIWAGVFFALEVILGDFSAGAFGTVVLSSLVASVVSHFFLQDHPVFLQVPQYTLVNPWVELPLYLFLGLLAALAATAFVKALYWTEGLFDNLRFPSWLKPAAGGLLLGVAGLLSP